MPLRASRNNKGVVLRVPRRILESNGFRPGNEKKRELVKLLIAWSLEDRVWEEVIFANYYPGERRAEVYLGRLGDAARAQLGVKEAARYDLQAFVEEFNGSKPMGLENMKLGTDGQSAWMSVDGKRVDLTGCQVDTFGSMGNLRCKLGDDGPDIKFEYDGRSSVARFKGRPLIEFMQVTGDELEIRYAQSREEKHAHRMLLSEHGTES